MKSFRTVGFLYWTHPRDPEPGPFTPSGKRVPIWWSLPLGTVRARTVAEALTRAQELAEAEHPNQVAWVEVITPAGVCHEGGHTTRGEIRRRLGLDPDPLDPVPAEEAR